MCTTSVAKVLKKVFVLGGTGFVGKRFIDSAITRNFEIVSLSRRGTPTDYAPSKEVTWVKGDASNKKDITSVFAKYGPFDGCVHAAGLLFDSKSGLQSINKYASGSSSEPSTNATYDQVTRDAAFNVLDVWKVKNDRCPFVFISAAEVSWTFPAPFDWLKRYLAAKLQVESKMLTLGNTKRLRPVIFRPSLIWTWDRPISALLSAAPRIQNLLVFC